MRKHGVRSLFLTVLFVSLVFFAGCGGDGAADEKADIDLTELNSNMVYSEVYNMVYEPQDYEGKTVKMQGLYLTGLNEATGETYTACLVQDATACCAQGLYFELKDEDAKYPEPNEDIIVVGIYELREQDGYAYPTLTNAVWEPAED